MLCGYEDHPGYKDGARTQIQVYQLLNQLSFHSASLSISHD